MEKLKLFIKSENELFALNDQNQLLEFKDGAFVRSNKISLPEIAVEDHTLVASNRLIIFNENSLTIFSLEDKETKFAQSYSEGINVYDTSVIDNFLCIYLNNNTCIVTNLKNAGIKYVFHFGIHLLYQRRSYF